MADAPLTELIDAYAEARHVHGDHTYNPTTKAARDAVFAALTQAADAGAAEPVAWMDDGSTRNGSDGQEYRVVTAKVKANMPRAASQAYVTPLYAAPPAQQIQQAVARAIENCAVICEAIEDDYQEREGHKYPELKSDAQTGARDCAAAIRKQGDDHGL